MPQKEIHSWSPTSECFGIVLLVAWHLFKLYHFRVHEPLPSTSDGCCHLIILDVNQIILNDSKFNFKFDKTKQKWLRNKGIRESLLKILDFPRAFSTYCIVRRIHTRWLRVFPWLSWLKHRQMTIDDFIWADPLSRVCSVAWFGYQVLLWKVWRLSEGLWNEMGAPCMPKESGTKQKNVSLQLLRLHAGQSLTNKHNLLPINQA